MGKPIVDSARTIVDADNQIKEAEENAIKELVNALDQVSKDLNNKTTQ